MTTPGAQPSQAGVPRWARRYVAIFLTVFTLSGLVGIEAWPLTGWRLFADTRERVQAGWEAVAVDRQGRERVIDFDRLPAGFQGDVQILNGFPELPRHEQAAVCDAWATALRARGQDVAAIRLYATRTDVGDRDGDRAAPPERTLRYVYQDGAVREVGHDAAT